MLSGAVAIGLIPVIRGGRPASDFQGGGQPKLAPAAELASAGFAREERVCRHCGARLPWSGDSREIAG